MPGDACPVAVGRGAVAARQLGDITDRREAELALHRLNRTLRTLSRGNEALVRAASEPALLREMCQVIVDTGGYRMAWIGIAEQDAAKSVTPAASAGEIGDYLDKAKITWADEPRGRGPHGRAIRSGEPQVTQNLQTDPSMALWQEAARESGFMSSAVLAAEGFLRRLCRAGDPLGGNRCLRCR